MSANQPQCSGLGLFQSFFHPQAFNNFTANMQQSPDQLMRGLVRWQVEAQSLAFRRAQAYLELPSRLAQCHTPQDLRSEQQRFMQTCLSQWSESSRAMMCAWAQMLQLPTAAAQTTRNEAPRDYLSFPEPRTLNGAAKDEPQQPGRKVA